MGHARRLAYAEHGRSAGDGAWMTCMERNSDIVLLSCYAPLFVNVSQLTGNGRSMQWSSDLIGYDALTSYGSPSYYAQMMFSTMVGDEILATDSKDIPTRQWQRRAVVALLQPHSKFGRFSLTRPRQQERRDLPEGREHRRKGPADQRPDQRHESDQPQGPSRGPGGQPPGGHQLHH